MRFTMLSDLELTIERANPHLLTLDLEQVCNLMSNRAEHKGYSFGRYPRCHATGGGNEMVFSCVECLTKIKGNFITEMKNKKRMDKGRTVGVTQRAFGVPPQIGERRCH